MDMMQIVVLGLVATILSLILKKQNPEFSLYISIVTGVLIFFMTLNKLSVVLEMIKKIAQEVEVNTIYIQIIFKIIGISYLAEFGSQLCNDAGESAISSKIEFAGKVLIMVVSAPILMTLMDLITKLLA
ncbi:MAG: stage III sporulation protein AD [Epulopiscium sp.]|nr:stage III sporulation protein AD [Candidatus Epulonipiscium sp.]